MEVKLKWFLNHVYCDGNGATSTKVYVYEDGPNFDPNQTENQALIMVYQSDYDAEYTVAKSILNQNVAWIYWTQNGIVVTVH
jgi:hypothetical protein